MGQRTYMNLNKTMAPGPQAYEIPSKVVESNGFSMGLKYKQDLNSTVIVPGPGQYSPERKERKFAFTMGSRYKTLDQKMKAGVPGPGEYDQERQKSIPSIKFGTSSRQSFDIKKHMPGPGEYVGNFDNVNKAAPKYGFGTGKREDSLEKLRKFIPGPGQYQQTDIMGKDGPSKSMGTKPLFDLQEKELQQRPGPGQYEPKLVTLKNSPSLKIGTAKRDDLEVKKQNEFKAPSTIYNPNDSFTKTQSASWGFGSSQRPALNDNKKATSIPGPNQYQIPSKANEGPKFVMGLKTKDPMESKDTKPGPGQYDTLTSSTSKIKNEPAFSMGSGLRSDIANLKEKNQLPGPGNYQSHDDTFIKRSAPSYGFGSSIREDSLEKSRKSLQGPGAYETQSFIGFDGRKNSISPKLNENFRTRESRNIPGPGSYENNSTTQILKQAPAFKMGTSKRQESVAKERVNFPDGTMYSPNDTFTKTKSAAYGFGSGQRKSLADYSAQKQPGPGQYQISSKIFDSTQSRFAMGIKVKDLQKLEVPGPGQYDQNSSAVKKNMPAFSMSGKTTELRKLEVPGPGEYKVIEKAIEGPQYGFGTGPRVIQKRDESPGPGSYKLPSKIANLPSYALPGQKDENKFV
eukprot:403350761